MKKNKDNGSIKLILNVLAIKWTMNLWGPGLECFNLMENIHCGILSLNPWSQLLLFGKVMELLGCAGFAGRSWLLAIGFLDFLAWPYSLLLLFFD